MADFSHHAPGLTSPPLLQQLYEADTDSVEVDPPARGFMVSSDGTYSFRFKEDGDFVAWDYKAGLQYSGRIVEIGGSNDGDVLVLR